MDIKSERERVKRVTSTFHSSGTTTDEDMFVGRSDQLYSLNRTLLTPCRHAAIYGPRGVGKTSLVQYVCKSFEEEGYELIQYQCNSKDTPDTLFRKLLVSTGNNIKISAKTESYERKLKAKAKLVVAEGGADTTRGEQTETSDFLQQRLTPDYIAANLVDSKVIYLLDEFDRLQGEDTIEFVSDLLKACSNYGASLKIVIAGVADSFDKLLKSHASISRCLDAIRVPSMETFELQQIIHRGLEKLEFDYSKDLIESITAISSGLPYFTHLLCEEVTIRSLFHEKVSADTSDLIEVLPLVIEKVVGSVVEEYESAVAVNESYKLMDYGQTSNTPAIVKKLVLFSLAVSEGNDLDNLSCAYSFLSERSNQWVPDDVKCCDDAEIEIVLEEIQQQSNFVERVHASFEFKNPFYKSYCILKCLSNSNANFTDIANKRIN